MIDATPYLRIPYAECNCLALTLRALKDRGCEIPDPQVSHAAPEPPGDWWRFWTPLPGDVGAWRPGDVVQVHGDPRGVGLVLDARARLLTTTPESGPVVVPAETFMRRGLIGAYRPRCEA